MNTWGSGHIGAPQIHSTQPKVLSRKPRPSLGSRLNPDRANATQVHLGIRVNFQSGMVLNRRDM